MFTTQTCVQRKPTPRPKNRVRDFFDVPETRVRANPAPPIYLHQETFTASTTTVSGVVYWLSKDPIGIAGGLNQYVFVDNNPVNFIDPFGLCKPKPGDKFSIFKPKDEPYVTGGRDSDGFLGEKTALMHGVANIPFVHEVSQRHDRQIDALGVEGVGFAIMNVPLMVTSVAETAVAGIGALVGSLF